MKKGEDAKARKDVKRFMWSQAFYELYPLTIGGGALMLSSYYNQAVPSLVGKLLDPASNRANNHGGSFVTSVVWVGVVGGAASFLRTLMLNQAQENIAARLRKMAFKSLLIHHDLEWFHMEGSGENEMTEPLDAGGKTNLKESVVSTTSTVSLGMTPGAIAVILKDDVDSVASTMTTTVANLLRSSSSCVFSSFNMILLNPSLFGLSLAVAPLVGSLALLTRKYIKKIVAVQQEASINAASFVEEKINHIAMVKMSNREMDEVETYGQIQDQLVGLGWKSAFANGLSMGTMFFLSTSALCGIMLTGGKAVEAKRMGHGQLVSFGSYSFLLALGSAGVVKALGEYSQGVQAATRLFALISPAHESSVNETNKICTSSGDSIDFSNIRDLRIEDLSFAYKGESSTPVLRDVSLTLSRGEIVAVVGKNGAGKSTIAMILAGLYKPLSGKILVEFDASSTNGTSQIDYAKDLTREAQAKLVQVVPQHPAIFNASILDNVKYSYPAATRDEVSVALQAANAETFVSKLEGEMDYQVGRNGVRLSGGQRQRLGLARALLASPTFLVLDEPASSLDAEGESAVVDAIKACRESDRSLLVITHSSKTVSLADRVVVLKEGRIAEQGTCSELRAKDGELCALMPDLP